MVVCPFFLRGDCKFGDRCRNEHPGAKPTGSFRGNIFGVSGSSGGFGGTNNNNICQHFLKGNCRYGNNCRFSHVKPSAGQGVFGGQTTFGQNRNTSVFGGGNKNMPFNRNQNRFGALASEGGMGMGASQQNVFGGRQQQSSTESMLQNPTQMTQIQQMVKRDMEAWETSKQWPLSCYTYLKDEPCLTGLLDFSPEEIRKEAYDAKIGNKVSAYEQGLKNLLARSKQRRMELRNINMHQLESEIRASISKHSGESSMSIQTVSQSASVFVGPTPMSQSQGLFSNNVVATQSGGLFGSSFTSQQPMGTFGSMAVSSATMTSNMSTGNTGIFGSTNPAQPTSPFGSASISQKTSPFSSVGTTNSSNTSFGPTNTRTSTFGTSQPAGGSSLFGSGNTGQPSMNIFGNSSSASQTSNVSGVAPSTCPLTCTEQDIAAFKADKFVLGQIPECPPPPEFCR